MKVRPVSSSGKQPPRQYCPFCGAPMYVHRTHNLCSDPINCGYTERLDLRPEQRERRAA